MKNQGELKLKGVCTDVKRTRSDSLIAMCLPYIILAVPMSTNGTDSISESLGEPEEVDEPDHPP